MYEVGQAINIGLYGGYKHKEKLKYKAIIHDIDKSNSFVIIHVKLPYGGYKKMFGYVSELKELEENYRKWEVSKC